MSKAIATPVRTTVNLDDVPARVIATARKLGASFVTRDKVHAARMSDVVKLASTGLSDRGIESLVTAVMGDRPQGFSSTAVGTYRNIAALIEREDVAATLTTGDARDVVIASLYRIGSGAAPKTGPLAGKSSQERMTLAADNVATGKGSADAVAAAELFKSYMSDAVIAELAAAAETKTRAPRGGTLNPDGVQGILPQDDMPAEDAPKVGAKGNGKPGAFDYRPATTVGLIAELTRRAGKAAQWDAFTLEAFEQLTAAVEGALTTAGALADA